jgi:hypothetical protein
LLQYLASKQTAFEDLLNKPKYDAGDEIIVDTKSIISRFDSVNTGLKNFLKIDDGPLYKLLYDFYFKEIQELIKTIDQKVVDLGKVPVMAHEEEAGEEAGGEAEGGGNGDGSTLATYPVSNKSQKNRNKGKGKGKGKTKSKSRKPNATKKNNRH